MEVKVLYSVSYMEVKVLYSGSNMEVKVLHNVSNMGLKSCVALLILGTVQEHCSRVLRIRPHFSCC